MTKPEKPLPVVGYARVSTTEQADSGLGLEAQSIVLAAKCNEKDWRLLEVVRDEGVSGSGLDRPGLIRAFSLIATGQARGLVVAKLDRLTRNLRDAVEVKDWLDQRSAYFVAADFGIDTSNGAVGRLMANVLVSFAEFERERISERTREAAAVRRSQGRRMAGNQAGVIDSMPEVAARIRREREAGSSWQKIADGLNRDGLPTARGGAEWRVSAVQVAAGYVRPPAKRKRSYIETLLARTAPAA
jgi:DNA invertase Pin-like site-specific DNA recombinase